MCTFIFTHNVNYVTYITYHSTYIQFSNTYYVCYYLLSIYKNILCYLYIYKQLEYLTTEYV